MQQCSNTAFAAEPVTTSVEIGISAMHFKYEEFNSADGSVLDTEQGGIPGLSLRLSMQRFSWMLEGAASYHQAQVDYSGQTNTGVPYNTRTDEKISDVAMRFGRRMGELVPVTPYLGMGYRRWDRDILPGALNGLFESYRWSYIWLGTNVQLSETQSATHLLDIGLIRPISPSMTVDFKGSYNSSPTVYPVGQNGWRLMLTSNLKIARNVQLTLEPYYEYWALGQSPIATSNGVSVYEPASKTNNVGLNVRLGQVFQGF